MLFTKVVTKTAEREHLVWIHGFKGHSRCYLDLCVSASWWREHVEEEGIHLIVDEKEREGDLE